MKKSIKKLTILCLVLGILLNLLQININLLKVKEINNIARDELIYPSPKVLANPTNINL